MMKKTGPYNLFHNFNIQLPKDFIDKIIINPPKQKQDSNIHQTAVFFTNQSGQLAMDIAALDKFLDNKSSIIKRFIERRLKLLLHRCSRAVREQKISLEIVNRLSSFCLAITPLIENSNIVMPTAVEFSALIDWYLSIREKQGPAVVLSTVCPDYPYDWVGTKAMYKNGPLGDEIGLIGESIMKIAPNLLQILVKTLNLSIAWVIGYAGFEAKPSNLENMKISAEEFRNRLEKSARKLEQKINIPVEMLPDVVGLGLNQFAEIREGFIINDFIIQRKGMDALASAVDARDWACVFYIANMLNAIIIDGASVYMGRKAYNKAKHILKPVNHTPSFYCVTSYLGFAG
jgi:hypothetical protein